MKDYEKVIELIKSLYYDLDMTEYECIEEFLHDLDDNYEYDCIDVVVGNRKDKK